MEDQYPIKILVDVCNVQQKIRRKVSEENRPTKEELLQFIETESFTTIGKRYKVSDNTIRK